MLAKLVQGFLIVGQNAVAVVSRTRIKVRSQSLMIGRIVAFQHRDTERFFRAKIMIKRTFGHFSGFQ